MLRSLADTGEQAGVLISYLLVPGSGELTGEGGGAGETGAGALAIKRHTTVFEEAGRRGEQERSLGRRRV